MTDQPLAGRRVVVTRAADQAGLFVAALARLGADVIAVPTIYIESDPAAIAAALAVPISVPIVAPGGSTVPGGSTAPGDLAWIVVTSVNGLDALLSADVAALDRVPLAVVGPATARAAARAGRTVGFVPSAATAAVLVDEFPEAPPGAGAVVVVQGNRAGPEVTDGLRAKGWQVIAAVAYRTLDAGADGDIADRLARAPCDVITFLSGSAVASFLDAYGRRALGRRVVCIGPSTAEACAECGVRVDAIAEHHTVDGVIAAVVALAGDVATQA